ncbi:hypothetical protein PHYPO_G00208600 [Pangasianodon hypophthalmus]|uniref:Uncharacterized protein n=1 Tax=Pangasianodon hypophthalmus TaxID=310915 RepID=A0A5N5PCL6_PANHP|nr:hypothetical protein PHYPO_G00208600 [Pangasianodon hypophthalmus]
MRPLSLPCVCIPRLWLATRKEEVELSCGSTHCGNSAFYYSKENKRHLMEPVSVASCPFLMTSLGCSCQS